MEYDKLIHLVEKNEISKAFNVLKQIIPEEEEDLLEELSVLSSRYDSFKRKERLGVFLNSESVVERNKITLGLIGLINMLKKKMI